MARREKVWLLMDKEGKGKERKGKEGAKDVFEKEILRMKRENEENEM